MKRHLVILLIVFMLVTTFITMTTFAAEGDDKHHVLILQSYDSQNSWSRSISEGFFETIDNQRGSILVSEEFMDTKRYREGDYYESFTKYFEAKYENETFSLIVTADNNAFNYVTKLNADFFGDTPVVFVGLNRTEDNVNLSQRYRGIYEDIDVASTLGIISDIHPDNSRILIVTDETVTGQAVLTSVKEAIKNFEGPQNVEFFMSSSLDAIDEKLDTLSRTDAVVMLLFNADATGRNYTYNEGLDEIYKRSPAPIYGMWKFYLNQGIVGGYLTDGYSHGMAAADLVIARLQGREMTLDELDYTKPKLYFDYMEMKKFGLESISLPNEAIVINRPTESVREMLPFLIGASVVTALFSLVLALWYMNRKSSMMNDTLEEEKARLTSMIDKDLNRMVDERTYELQLANHQCEIMKEEYDIVAAEKKELEKKLSVCTQVANNMVFESDNLLQKMVELDLTITLYRIYMKNNFKSAMHIKELLGEIGISKDKIEKIKGLYAAGDMKRKDIESYFKNRSMAIDKFEERLHHVLDDVQILMDSNTIDVGAVPKPVCATDVIGSAFKLAEMGTTHRLIEFESDIEADLPEISHSSYVSYIILQVVSNALQHGFKGMDSGIVTLNAHSEGRVITIVVKDNGLGMDDEVLSKAFEPFYSTAHEEGNLGVGLGNVKDIVEEKFNGKIRVTSSVNEGTTVKIVITA